GGVRHRRCEVEFAGGALEMGGDAAARLHALKLLEEIDMEIRAPKFTVGDACQADVLLQAHDVANRFVFRRSQLVAGERALLKTLARFEQFHRPQEAADVISAERRCGPLRHETSPFGRSGYLPGSFTFANLSNSTLYKWPSTLSTR